MSESEYVIAKAFRNPFKPKPKSLGGPGGLLSSGGWKRPTHIAPRGPAPSREVALKPVTWREARSDKKALRGFKDARIKANYKARADFAQNTRELDALTSARHARDAAANRARMGQGRYPD